MQQHHPGVNKYLSLWVTKYDFDGSLSPAKILQLQHKIHEKTNGKTKKLKRNGWSQTEVWMTVAKTREEAKRKNREQKSDPNEYKMVMVSKEEEMVIKKKERPQPQPQPDPPPQRDPQPEAIPPIYRDLSGVDKHFDEPPPRQETPPPYEHTHRKTRKDGPVGEWSNTLGRSLSPPPPKCRNPFLSGGGSNSPDDAQLYPLIQVPNPHGNGDATAGNEPTCLVYRTWTLDDVKKALEGIPPFEEDPHAAAEGLRQVAVTYYLNGIEAQQVWMQHTGIKWNQIRGDWDPAGMDGHPLPWNSEPLRQRLLALELRARNQLAPRANYAKINQVNQKEGEDWDTFRHRMEIVFRQNSGVVNDGDPRGPYQQQLKNALHQGSRPPIRQWVQKYFVAFPVSTLEDYEVQA